MMPHDRAPAASDCAPERRREILRRAASAAWRGRRHVTAAGQNQFYLHDRYQVSHDDGAASAAPEAVIVGPQSYRRTRLILSGSIHVFTIRFQPGGFHALFSTPMTILVNEGVAIGDVIGTAAVGLRDAVMSARDFGECVAAAERWLWGRLGPSSQVDGVARSAAALQRSCGRLAVD